MIAATMPNSEPNTAQPSTAPYIWAVVILTMIGAVLTMAVLKLRPQYDPLLVIAAITTGLAPTTAAVLALMKSQETHLSVNSRLDVWMREHGQVKLAEGRTLGAAEEHARGQALAEALKEPPRGV
jgi:hypothetical protein